MDIKYIQYIHTHSYKVCVYVSTGIEAQAMVMQKYIKKNDYYFVQSRYLKSSDFCCGDISYAYTSSCGADRLYTPLLRHDYC